MREQLDELRSGGWERSARDAKSVPLVDTGSSATAPWGGNPLPVLVSPLADARYGPTAALGIPAVDEADATIAGRVPRLGEGSEPDDVAQSTVKANKATRHRKPRPIRDASRMGGTQMTPGGMVDKPMAVPVGNVMLVCPTCKLPTRVGFTTKEGKGGVVKVRVCKREGCGQEIDR